MNKHEIAHVFERIAVLLDILGENPFRVYAYRKAARRVEGISEELSVLIRENRLTEIPDIGKELAEKITILHNTGTLPFYENLKNKFPEGLIDLLKVPGLGAKKLKTLYEKLGIQNIDDLRKACEDGSIAKLKGFGEKTALNILEGMKHVAEYTQKQLWWNAKGIAAPLVEELSQIKVVEKVEIAGSLRRKTELVRDLDILAVSDHPNTVMEWFVTQPWVGSVTSKGNTKGSVRLLKGMQADLRVINKKEFPFAQIYSTGSKEHNIKLRAIAKAKGWTLSEYALEGCSQDLNSEEDIYKALGLAYIPPELREDRGEIEAAAAGKLPTLIQIEDIKGLFHVHTTYSDGHNTLEEMAHAADAWGFEYLGISDHSKSSIQANGMDEKRLLEQNEAIQKINRSKQFKVHLFSGIECDILNDGSLDFPDEILKKLDFVIVSIHRRYKQDEELMTQRIIKAIENPYSTMVGHLSGRILLKREPYAIDVEKVIDAAIANHKIIELNAWPNRLDMDWRFWHRAKEKGLMCSINPDAHRTHELAYFQAGVNCAKKGWLEKQDVLNSFPLSKVQHFLSTFDRPTL